MTLAGAMLAQAVPLVDRGLRVEDLWLPALVLLGMLLYWRWLCLIIPRMRSRRGVILAVAAHLAAAVAINVAIAWVAALLVGGAFRNGVAMPWVGAGPNPNSPRQVALFAAGQGPTHRAVLGLYDDGAFCHEHVVLEAGFPFACLRGTWHDPASPGIPTGNYLLIHRISLTAPMAPGVRVPIEPLPLRFLLNTLVYAAILALLLAPFKLRQRWRHDHGRCARCGYDLTGIEGRCPECGAARDYFDVTAGCVPMRPMLRGSANNVLLYARAFLALPLSVIPIRRRLRGGARRGRCPKCGYDLAGLASADRGGEGGAPCPECGATR